MDGWERFLSADIHRQKDWPLEDADANSVVQIAIVYQGKTVTIYRDAQPYAKYTISAPQIFKEDVMVLLGMRYVGQPGEIGPLVGAIDDARAYGDRRNLFPAQKLMGSAWRTGNCTWKEGAFSGRRGTRGC